MSKLKFALTALACLHAVQAFTCPQDSHGFYHADVSTGCQVYHRCENSVLQTFTCPSGQAFNHETSACEDASTVDCYETMGDHSHHHHHKRSVEQYHTIDIQEFKTKVIEAFQTLRPALKDAIRSIAPSIYAKFEDSYLPSLREATEQVMPFFREKLYPYVQKWLRYSISLFGKLFEKFYRSYELSNSTHITIASMSDIVEQVSNDIKPILGLGKFLSTTVMPENSVRSKREVGSIRQVGDMDPVEQIVLGVLGNTLERSTSVRFLSGGDSFIMRIAVPTLHDMVNNEKTRSDASLIAKSARSIFSPVAREILNRQSDSSPQDTTIKIPKEVYAPAVEKFVVETHPLITRIIERHIRGILSHAAENIPLVEELFDFLESMNCPRAAVVRVAVIDFLKKHGSLMRASTDSHIDFHPLPEILGDSKRIKETMTKLLLEYFEDEKWAQPVFGPMKKGMTKHVKTLSKFDDKRGIY